MLTVWRSLYWHMYDMHMARGSDSPTDRLRYTVHRQACHWAGLIWRQTMTRAHQHLSYDTTISSHDVPWLCSEPLRDLTLRMLYINAPSRFRVRPIDEKQSGWAQNCLRHVCCYHMHTIWYGDIAICNSINNVRWPKRDIVIFLQ